MALTIPQFYSDIILSKRGPLARIWIAAHIEKKLSKKEAINTDIGESVGRDTRQTMHIY